MRPSGRNLRTGWSRLSEENPIDQVREDAAGEEIEGETYPLIGGLDASADTIAFASADSTNKGAITTWRFPEPEAGANPLGA